MQHNALRGWLCEMQKFLRFKDFLNTRAVCKNMYNSSKNCNRHWYHWLERRGDKQKLVVICHDHVWNQCHNFAAGNCTQRHHYREWSMKPVLLKTVPLHEQVMRQISRRARKKIKNRLNGFVDLKRVLEDDLVSCKRNLQTAIAEQVCYDRVVSKHTYTNKRSKIEVEDF